MNSLDAQLAVFQGVSLEGLDSIKLMQRHDTKYLFHRDQFPAVLAALYNDYRILEIDGKRAFRYETVYYDTDDYYFYHQHHNRRLNRYKVRSRRYADSGLHFFEIKFKDNKGKTTKKRREILPAEFGVELNETAHSFAHKHFRERDRHLIRCMRPKIQIDYRRITLANPELKERLTFDVDLAFVDSSRNEHSLGDLVIAELKQETVNRMSPIVRVLRDLRIKQGNFSKYCMGVVKCTSDVRKNRFKRKTMYIHKLTKGR